MMATSTLRVGALALVVATPMFAQDGAPVLARPPLTPDSVLTAGPLDAGFETWRTSVEKRGRAGVSFLVEGSRYQVLVMTPMAVDALTPDSLTLKNSKGCKEALELDDLQVANTAEIRPWTAFDSATRVRPVIAFTVLPVELRRFDCHKGLLARFAALSRGVMYGRFAPYSAQADVARAEVRLRGALLAPQLSGRAKVSKYDVGAGGRDGSEMLRLYVEVDAFAPDEDGEAPQLEIHVWNGVDEEPEILPLPAEVSRAVWQRMMPWRARTLQMADGAAAAPTLELKTPRDSVLREAHERYRSGDLAGAAGVALDRLEYRPLPARREVLDAMLLASSVFATHGEDESALFLMSDVMEVFPCLTLAASAPESMREMADLERTPARCTSIPLPIIALRSIVPGAGQATGPLRKRLALTLFSSTAGSYVLASALHSYARGQYAKYLAYDGTTSPPSEAIIGHAQTARTVANGLTIAAATVWVGAAVEALWAEHLHARRLAEVRDVGATRRAARADALEARLAPSVTPQGVGMALTLRFK